jgi:hypothetical protein
MIGTSELQGIPPTKFLHIYKGYMEMQFGEDKKTKQYRYFELRGNLLSYYRSSKV